MADVHHADPEECTQHAFLCQLNVFGDNFNGIIYSSLLCSKNCGRAVHRRVDCL